MNTPVDYNLRAAKAEELCKEMLEVLKTFPMLLVPAKTAYGKEVQDWQEKALSVIAKVEEGL